MDIPNIRRVSCANVNNSSIDDVEWFFFYLSIDQHEVDKNYPHTAWKQVPVSGIEQFFFQIDKQVCGELAEMA